MHQIRNLRDRALTAGVWTTLGFGAQKVLQLVSNLALTRLLFPQAFGLMALANVILVGLAMFSDIGIKPSIVQNERGEEEPFLNTAWTIQIIRGFALWAGACLLAYPASLLYREATLFPLICLMGVTAAISGFSTTALAVRERRLNIAALTIVQTIGQLVSLAITVLLAWWFRSVWALAFGAIVGSVVSLIIGYVLIPSHRHHIHLESRALSSLISFGRWIFLGTIVTYLAGNGIRAIQGIFLPIEILGILSIAQNLAWMPGDFISRLVSTIGFPALSEVRTRRGDFSRALNRIRFTTLGLVLPAFILLALIAGPLVHFLYDQRYASADRYLAILAISGALAVIPMGYSSAFLAQGDSRLHFFLLSALMAFRVIGLVVGFEAGGVYGMLIGDTIGITLLYPVVAIQAARRGIASFKIDLACFLFVTVGAAVMTKIYF